MPRRPYRAIVPHVAMTARRLARAVLVKYTIFIMYNIQPNSLGERSWRCRARYIPSLAFWSCLALASISCAPSAAGSAGVDAAASMPASEAIEPAGPGLVGHPPLIPLKGPIKIGIQPGHWRIEDLPDELARLRTSTGAAFGQLRELDINLAVSRILLERLLASGYDAELVPAAVPAGYRADLFVSVHADRADQPDRRGWKLSPPWRASPASKSLAAAMIASFAESGLPEDKNGITANMRGYFGFSWWRFENALSPYTPAVLVELGFLGNAVERARMRDDPGFYAAILERGISRFLEGYRRDDPTFLVPIVHEARLAGPAGVRARAAPSDSSAVLERYEAGRLIRPVDEAPGGWFEVFSRALWRGVWVHESELE